MHSAEGRLHDANALKRAVDSLGGIPGGRATKKAGWNYGKQRSRPIGSLLDALAQYVQKEDSPLHGVVAECRQLLRSNGEGLKMQT